MAENKKPWSGRFDKPTDKLVEDFTASIDFDRRLYRYDIEGSIAHCRMLAKKEIITGEEEKAIIAGLKDIRRDIEAGNFSYSSEFEDIHMAVERSLVERIGEAAERLHTARSRNDQVSLDMRLYLRDEVKNIIDLIATLQGSLVDMAKRNIDVIMPGYTHLQRAQPVLLSHYLLAYWEMLKRDGERLKECRRRINVMPLGSAALAGTGIPIDREYVAELLDFPEITKNSMDTVSDRDFVAEFIFDISMLMMHLSRFCEDIIIWSSGEFGFVEISDSFTTGSSIMPQKKNPDVAELIRGKAARVYGNLVTIMTIMKGLPMTYNRDLQEDKEPLFDTVDTAKNCLRVLSEMTKEIKFNEDRMMKCAVRGFSTATDVAEYLVIRGVPFRKAHAIVGNIVKHCIEKKRDLCLLTMEEFRRFYVGFEKDIYKSLGADSSINKRNIVGGTSKKMVMKRIEEIENAARSKSE